MKKMAQRQYQDALYNHRVAALISGQGPVTEQFHLNRLLSSGIDPQEAAVQIIVAAEFLDRISDHVDEMPSAACDEIFASLPFTEASPAVAILAKYGIIESED